MNPISVSFSVLSVSSVSSVLNLSPSWRPWRAPSGQYGGSFLVAESIPDDTGECGTIAGVAAIYAMERGEGTDDE